jgi:PAS domain S-box-containing protein
MQTSESQERAADLTITDAIPIGISVLAPDGTTLYVNRQALDNVGVALDEVMGKGHLARTCHPDDLDRVLGERRMGLSKGVPFELEMRLLPVSAAKRTQGEYRWYLSHYNPLKDETGQIIRWYVTATDIDDRKRAEERLRHSEVDLRTIIDGIRQSVVVLAPDGAALYANRVALDITGLTFEEVNDDSFLTRAFHPDDVDRMREERQEKLSRGAPFETEMRVALKSGEYRWFLSQYNPLRDERGRVLRWYVTGTDIEGAKENGRASPR